MFQIGEVWKIKLPERCHIESIWESRVGVQGLCDGYLILLFMVWSYLLSNVSFLFWNYQSDDFLHSAAWLCLSFSYFSVLNGAGKITHLYSFSHCFQCREAQNSSKPALLYTWCGQIQEFLKLLMLSLILLLLCLYYCIISLRELCVLKWVELLKWSGEVNLELACPFPIKQEAKKHLVEMGNKRGGGRWFCLCSICRGCSRGKQSQWLPSTNYIFRVAGSMPAPSCALWNVTGELWFLAA